MDLNPDFLQLILEARTRRVYAEELEALDASWDTAQLPLLRGSGLDVKLFREKESGRVFVRVPEKKKDAGAGTLSAPSESSLSGVPTAPASEVSPAESPALAAPSESHTAESGSRGDFRGFSRDFHKEVDEFVVTSVRASLGKTSQKVVLTPLDEENALLAATGAVRLKGARRIAVTLRAIEVDAQTESEPESEGERVPPSTEEPEKRPKTKEELATEIDELEASGGMSPGTAASMKGLMNFGAGRDYEDGVEERRPL
jgi:hypothetical protein